MKRRSLILSSLTALAVSLPAAAFAWGGGCAGGPAGGPGGFAGGPGFGPGGDPAAMSEALNATKIDLVRALEAAHAAAPGAIGNARLMPYAPQAAQGDTNSFARPALAPTYVVTLREPGNRTMVTVDAVSGKATVAGTATGVLATPGRPFDNAMSPRSMRGQRGGPFGPPADMTGVKVDAAEAVAVATKAVKQGKPVMVKGAQRGDDKAWVVGLAGPEPVAFTLVFVDPTAGTVLDSRSMTPTRMGPPPAAD
ncbi:PepSY domain-containing protein [Pararhodospirillum oryzae]|uniref:Uncharacterized protein n=1 Tax=Pararhodospirillum oryzae TaxID=478448 RepID=A0A512H8Y6_9PROT|nr:PepSY domain-containing protein [Pararhodospirillum oryzae]GEO81911.1 hypothetical protein ROR02_20420 [Pararhodospirillum oryzae]